MDQLLIEPAYAGPVSYFQKLCNASKIIFDVHAHYEKRSFRNRCDILGANGIMHLSIPLQKGKHQKQILKDVRISYAENWQKDHWVSLVSSYRRAPFFEFYEDALRPFYEKKMEFLADFNLQYFECLNKALKTGIEFSVTENYIPKGSFEGEDLRDCFSPKSRKEIKPYLQVFSDRSGFATDLSILDLVFNLGTRSNEYLRQI